MKIEDAQSILGQAAVGNLTINDEFKEACRMALELMVEHTYALVTAKTFPMSPGVEFDQKVAGERERQDKKWGEQNHSALMWHVILVEEVGELSHEILEGPGGLTPSPGQKYRMEHELIEVAAVAKAMWESGKRNGWL